MPPMRANGIPLKISTARFAASHCNRHDVLHVGDIQPIAGDRSTVDIDVHDVRTSRRGTAMEMLSKSEERRCGGREAWNRQSVDQ
jgi:hypothetical protein